MRLILCICLLIGSTTAFRPLLTPGLTRSIGVKLQKRSIPKFNEEKSLNALPPMKQIFDGATNVFPLWVLSSSVLGWLKPCAFQWFAPYVTPALALTMLSMGMTLTWADMKRVVKTPQWVLVGFLAQFRLLF